MAVQETTSAISGLSSGKFLLLSAVVTIGVIVILFLKFKNEKNNIVDIDSLSTDDEKYERNVWKINDAIARNDVAALKELLTNHTIQKHNDLTKKIKDFLEKYNN